MTEKQKQTQKILRRNNEIDRHVRTLEKLFDVNKERAKHSLDKEVKDSYFEKMAELKKAQSDLKKSIEITEKLISLVEDATQRDILSLYHVACIPMDEVAYVVHYDRSNAWRKYKIALDNLAIVLDNELMIK